MRDAGQQDITTVTLAFREYRGRPDDEAPLAARTAARYGTRHVTRPVDEAEFRADLPAILAAMDQPSIDGLNTWFVAKAAREQGLKVALSGLGGLPPLPCATGCGPGCGDDPAPSGRQ